MTTPDWAAAAMAMPPNVVDMRFGPVRLTIASDKPLPADTWSSIGYAAHHIESLANTVKQALAADDADQHEGEHP